MKVGALVLAVLMVPVLVLARSAPATATDAYSVSGAGYGVAKTVFNGTFVLQSSGDPTKNTLTYSKQSLDGSSTVILTRTPELKACP